MNKMEFTYKWSSVSLVENEISFHYNVPGQIVDILMNDNWTLLVIWKDLTVAQARIIIDTWLQLTQNLWLDGLSKNLNSVDEWFQSFLN